MATIEYSDLVFGESLGAEAPPLMKDLCYNTSNVIMQSKNRKIKIRNEVMFDLYSGLPHVNEVLYTNIFSSLPPDNFSSTNSPSTLSDWPISVIPFQGFSRLASTNDFRFLQFQPGF